MNRTNPKVDAFIKKEKKWQKEFQKMRQIVLAFPLTEELKWRLPCYALQGGNVLILQRFKEYCALMFFKGALLKDPKGILVAPGASQAGRQIRFTSVGEIVKLEPSVRAYIDEAIRVERAGLKVTLRKTSEFAVPDEFQSKLDEDPALRAAFEALTPGRQRAYLFYFDAPKQSKTREARIEKYVPQILKGKGLND